jgi:outer membrane protein assembly factor BamB
VAVHATCGAAEPDRNSEAPAARDPCKHLYAGYTPDFMRFMKERGWAVSEKKMRLSSEWAFFTLSLIHEDSRADALVAAARDREEQGRYRDALKMYQLVIDKYPQALFRVSRFGVFVPIAQYCQRRILNFPPAQLAHYRTLYDPRAREAFEQARRKHSLIGLSEVADGMLATSYGGRALLELGNAALDSGHYLAALERFAAVRDFFPRGELRTPELKLKVRYCRKMLSQPPRPDPPAPAGATTDECGLTIPQLARLRRIIDDARPEAAPFLTQAASAPHVAADDYTLFPATQDPLGVEAPVWRRPLPGTRRDFYVYTQPVVTGNSVVYRHKNIVYSRSILTGELRWQNDLGGRAGWQHGGALRYPQEDALVQDGLVFTVVSKGGPSLVALDEVTGQLRWAYGPMVASTVEESRMRFEAAPAGGPLTVYAGYVLDNIEGDTHIDTEYGLIAFESTTGRIRWRTPLCRLTPGKFAAGFAVRRRNRIRSFTSPPLYHQGTIYYGTNAGAIAAVEALSGRVKWLMRYPYYHTLHDSTRGFGRRHHYKYLDRPKAPMLWYNQRPLVHGEQLYVLPVDTPFFFCLHRRDGRVRWTHRRAGRGVGYFLGPERNGQLVVVYTGRKMYHRPDGWTSNPPLYLLDPKTGKTLWTSPDLILHTDQAVMANLGINQMFFCMGARPFLTADNRLYVPNFLHVGWPVYGHVQHLTCFDLNERKIVSRRRYYDGAILGFASRILHDPAFRWYAPRELKELENLPHKDKKTRDRIAWLKKVIASRVPVNPHGPMWNFSRVTFDRYGVRFELRLSPRDLSMVYDRAAVQAALANRKSPEAVFARAELALADSRLERAARLLGTCLDTVSSEDVDFRALIKQQLFRAHTRLARSAIRSVRPDRELEHVLGMSRTAGTLAEEMETLFALADAYERRGEPTAAARCLRSLIAVYGHHEFPIAPVAAAQPDPAAAVATGILDKAEAYANNPFYSRSLKRSLTLTRKGLPLYFSTVSPLPRPLTVRAGELAARRLLRLQQTSDEFDATFEVLARRELGGRAPDEQFHRLWQFPGTAAAQKAADALFERAAGGKGLAARQRLWQLADAARVCRLTVPEAARPRVMPPPAAPAPPPIHLPHTERKTDLSEAEGINWLVLERRGDRSSHPQLAFLGGRVRKRLDNKFLVACMDLTTGKSAWRQERIRLKGKGQEPGFFDAFVRGGVVVVHGLYDVLAFDVTDGSLRWRFRTPFDFEIQHAVMTGDLLVLAGETETFALYLPARGPAGEVAWRAKEMGDLYRPPYVCGDRLIQLRKMPFNLTARSRATGRLIGRLELPDLSLHTAHPLLDHGPAALPAAHDGDRLVVTDGWYYIALDATRLRVLWKRLIDNNDPSREPAMRFTLQGPHLLVLKQDYDQKVVYMLDSRTGTVRWHTDVKDANSPRPMHSTFIRGDTAYGLRVHPGQGFYFTRVDCKTGKRLCDKEIKGYQGKPEVTLMPRRFGSHIVVKVRDRKEFELKVLDVRDGKVVHTLHKKGVAPFGEHGRVSATVQDGRLILLSKNDLSL